MYGNRIKDAIYVVPLIYSLVEIADFVFKKVNTSGGRLPLNREPRIGSDSLGPYGGSACYLPQLLS
jgi:hypothetical protein